ncbi:MAG: UvrD-helicase domain-containing protein [Cyanobium sp.]
MRLSNQPSGLFAAATDEQLLRLGVPPALLPSVRAVRQEEDLSQLLQWLPAECVDSLILLADGRSVEEVINELERQTPDAVDPTDVDQALDRIDSQAEFVVITDDEALEAILSAPMEQWRVFLHPTQKKLVRRGWNGPVRVLGGAGTGKTVVAMHRALWLAQQCIDHPEPGRSDRVLFTTYTHNLATDIRGNLAKICTPQQLQHIEVTHLDGWVGAYLRSQGLTLRQFDREARAAAWTAAMVMAKPELNLPQGFYEEEWREVVVPQACGTLEDYLAAKRLGRGTRLNALKRLHIWPVFDALRSELRRRGLWEPEEAKQAAADRLQAASAMPRYRSVVVDEAQDLDAASFRLIRALTGKEHADDIFIVGDSHQRIYGRPLVLSQCGIQVRGRAKKLRINYRTTEETRAWASAVLRGLAFDDLDGGSDTSGDYRSLLHGDHPILRGFEDPADELAFLASHLRSIQQRDGGLSATCVTCWSNEAVRVLVERFNLEGIATQEIKPDEADDPSNPALRLATMQRVKGLEFDHIVIPNLSADLFPDPSLLNTCPDQVSRDNLEQRLRSLLHVAATRARKQVLITYSGVPSPYLPKPKDS